MGEGTSNFPASMEPQDISYRVWRTWLTGQSRAGWGGLAEHYQGEWGRGGGGERAAGRAQLSERGSRAVAAVAWLAEDRFYRCFRIQLFFKQLHCCTKQSPETSHSQLLFPRHVKSSAASAQRDAASGVYTKYTEEVNALQRCRSPSSLRQGLGAEGNPAEQQLALAVWYLFIGASWVLKSLL